MLVVEHPTFLYNITALGCIALDIRVDAVARNDLEPSNSEKAYAGCSLRCYQAIEIENKSAI